MKRRDFLARGLQSLLLAAAPIALPEALAVSKDDALEREVFRDYLDTLIPADLTPSASQLGMVERLTRHSRTLENYPELIRLGCRWLNEQSVLRFRVSFDRLTPEGREQVVGLAETSASGSVPRQFFDRVKSDLFGLYYAHPASWVGLGFASPPQPRGYPDYRLAVKRSDG